MMASNTVRGFVLTVALGACVTHDPPPITGTQSLQIDMITPSDPGSINNRIADSARAVSFNITAFDVNGNPDTSYNNTLQVYVYYLGTLTPYLGGSPLATVPMVAGKGTLSTTLPPVFGATTVWFDDGTDTAPTYASGVSPTLWYRDPFVSDIETPADETSIAALEAAPLDNKNIDVRVSKYGATGRLVITSVFSQGYTLADVNCADANGTPPCVSKDYDYVEVFSYSAPQDQDRRYVNEGEVIDGFAGGVTEFDGLTEIGFPQTFVSGDPDVNTAREPATAVFNPTWYGTAPSEFPPTGTSVPGIMFERNEGGAVEVDNAKVCAIDSDYVTFKQWKIDPAGVADAATCANNKVIINVVSTGVAEIDPSTLVGKTLPRVVGMLRPINLSGFNVWIIYPRSVADFTTN